MNNLEKLIEQTEKEAALSSVSPEVLIQYLDLTSLNATDDEPLIDILCQRALMYKPAAVCIYPAFVKQVARALEKTSIQVATVANFPGGAEPLDDVLSQIEQVLAFGATEVDVVMPYQVFLESKNTTVLKKFVQVCKALLRKRVLKIILESGAFVDMKLLKSAALACLEGGADFLKTSTGKTPQGASLIAAANLMNAIQVFGDLTRGVKLSGGVRHAAQAQTYYQLAQNMMGEHWPSQKTFRIGASVLLDELVKNIY